MVKTPIFYAACSFHFLKQSQCYSAFYLCGFVCAIFSAWTGLPAKSCSPSKTWVQQLLSCADSCELLQAVKSHAQFLHCTYNLHSLELLNFNNQSLCYPKRFLRAGIGSSIYVLLTYQINVCLWMCPVNIYVASFRLGELYQSLQVFGNKWSPVSPDQQYFT